MGERNMQTSDDEEMSEIPPAAFDEGLLHFRSEREKLAEYLSCRCCLEAPVLLHLALPLEEAGSDPFQSRRRSQWLRWLELRHAFRLFVYLFIWLQLWSSGCSFRLT